jgi:hypothetical protein
MMYGMIFIPLALAFAFHHREEDPFPHIVLDINDRFVGAYGLWSAQWLTFTLGRIGGTVALIGVAAISFLIHFGQWVENGIENWKLRRQEKQDRIDEAKANTDAPYPTL